MRNRKWYLDNECMWVIIILLIIFIDLWWHLESLERAMRAYDRSAEEYSRELLRVIEEERQLLEFLSEEEPF